VAPAVCVRGDLPAAPLSSLPAQRIRVRVEIMGSQKCRIVGKSQPVLVMIDPIIFTRTRMVMMIR
jgi:hypothetical protein